LCQKKKRTPAALGPKNKNDLKKQSILMYNKNGNACYDLNCPSFEIYC
jgi:hypothetical protein